MNKLIINQDERIIQDAVRCYRGIYEEKRRSETCTHLLEWCSVNVLWWALGNRRLCGPTAPRTEYSNTVDTCYVTAELANVYPALDRPKARFPSWPLIFKILTQVCVWGGENKRHATGCCSTALVKLLMPCEIVYIFVLCVVLEGKGKVVPVLN
jgi:hypothetical protein